MTEISTCLAARVTVKGNIYVTTTTTTTNNRISSKKLPESFISKITFIVGYQNIDQVQTYH